MEREEKREKREKRDNRAAARRNSAARRKLLVSAGDGDMDQHLASVRSKLIDAVIIGFVVITLFLLPASLYRVMKTGWLYLYTAQVVAASATIALFLLRKRLGERSKAAAVVAIFWVVGLSGLVTMGLAGAGIWFLVISSLMVSLL